MGAVVRLDTFGCRQVDAGVVADALQDVGQEQVLGVEGDVQQEPGGGGSEEHPQIPELATPQNQPCVFVNEN